MATQPLSHSGTKYSATGYGAGRASRPISAGGTYAVTGHLMVGGVRPVSAVSIRLGSGGFARDGALRPITPGGMQYADGTLLSLLNLRLLSKPVLGYLAGSLLRDGSSRPISTGYALFIPEEPPPPVDATPPVVGNFSPVAGTPISKVTPIAFDVTDESGAFRRIFVVAFYPTTGISEVIHDGDGFRGYYSATSARQAIAGGFRYSVLRAGGWSAAPTIQTFAIDLAGNEVSN